VKKIIVAIFMGTMATTFSGLLMLLLQPFDGQSRTEADNEPTLHASGIDGSTSCPTLEASIEIPDWMIAKKRQVSELPVISAEYGEFLHSMHLLQHCLRQMLAIDESNKVEEKMFINGEAYPYEDLELAFRTLVDRNPADAHNFSYVLSLNDEPVERIVVCYGWCPTPYALDALDLGYWTSIDGYVYVESHSDVLAGEIAMQITTLFAEGNHDLSVSTLEGIVFLIGGLCTVIGLVGLAMALLKQDWAAAVLGGILLVWGGVALNAMAATTQRTLIGPQPTWFEQNGLYLTAAWLGVTLFVWGLISRGVVCGRGRAATLNAGGDDAAGLASVPVDDGRGEAFLS
jgi:hypothetical protein